MCTRRFTLKISRSFYDARDPIPVEFRVQRDAGYSADGTIHAGTETYGTREVSIDVLEKMTVTSGRARLPIFFKGQAGNSALFKLWRRSESGNEILHGCGRRYDRRCRHEERLSAQQVVSINSDQLDNVDQLIQPGMVLNVTNFQSPITVELRKSASPKKKFIRRIRFIRKIRI